MSGLISSYHRPRMKEFLLRGMVPTWLQNHKRKRYIVDSILSFPAWVSRAELMKIEEKAQYLTRTTGIKHHIDHIIPLRHPKVCGLSVPENFQVIPWRMNLVKGNRWSDAVCEQLELLAIESCEQYCLPF